MYGIAVNNRTNLKGTFKRLFSLFSCNALLDARMYTFTKVKLAVVGIGRQCVARRTLNAARAVSRGFASSELEEESSTSDNELYDIIISGGGMVGTAMACSLGKCYYRHIKCRATLLSSASYPFSHAVKVLSNFANAIKSFSSPNITFPPKVT